MKEEKAKKRKSKQYSKNKNNENYISNIQLSKSCSPRFTEKREANIMGRIRQKDGKQNSRHTQVKLDKEDKKTDRIDRKNGRLWTKKWNRTYGGWELGMGEKQQAKCEN